MSKVILTIDIGTTGSRVIAFDEQGNVVASQYQEVHMSYPQTAWVEQDPMELVNLIKQLLQQVAAQVTDREIVGCTITNQRETIIVWDAQTGQPLYPAIVWQDKRTRVVCAQLEPEYGEFVHQETGLRLDPYFSASKLKWIVDTVKPQGSFCFGTPESFVLWHLTADHRYITEISNASRTLLFSIKTMSFEPRLARVFGLPEDLMYPAVIDSDGDFGSLDPAIMGTSLPILAVLGDQQASLFGQTGFSFGLPKNTYGTGLFVMSAIGNNPIYSDQVLTTIAGKMNHQVTFAHEGSVFIGGSVIQWLRDQLKLIQHASETEAIAQSIPSTDGVYLVPAFAGLGAPHWQPDAKAVMVGMTRATTREHVVRAALESMAYQTRDVLEVMISANQANQPLQVDGGATANTWLMQFVADICQRPVVVAPIAETTAWGSALLGGIKIGMYHQNNCFAHDARSKTYIPQMTHELSNQLYTGWQDAITRSLT
jgi:glycerol kinase